MSYIYNIFIIKSDIERGMEEAYSQIIRRIIRMIILLKSNYVCE